MDQARDPRAAPLGDRHAGRPAGGGARTPADVRRVRLGRRCRRPATRRAASRRCAGGGGATPGRAPKCGPGPHADAPVSACASSRGFRGIRGDRPGARALSGVRSDGERRVAAFCRAAGAFGRRRDQGPPASRARHMVDLQSFSATGRGAARVTVARPHPHGANMSRSVAQAPRGGRRRLSRGALRRTPAGWEKGVIIHNTGSACPRGAASSTTARELTGTRTTRRDGSGRDGPPAHGGAGRRRDGLQPDDVYVEPLAPRDRPPHRPPRRLPEEPPSGRDEDQAVDGHVQPQVMG